MKNLIEAMWECIITHKLDVLVVFLSVSIVASIFLYSAYSIKNVIDEISETRTLIIETREEVKLIADKIEEQQ